MLVGNLFWGNAKLSLVQEENFRGSNQPAKKHMKVSHKQPLKSHIYISILDMSWLLLQIRFNK